MIALRLQNLHKTYNNGVVAIHDLSLEIQEGDFFALLGPNGAGKSTVIGIISSLVNKNSGKVQVFGHDLDTETNKAKCLIGLVPQEHNFNIFEPIIEVLINQAGYYGIPRKIAFSRAENLLKQLELYDKRHSGGRELSGGMKRRLMIARALMNKPRLLILDEPTAGVDVEIRQSMWKYLKDINAQGTTIILTTHYLEEAEQLCRNIAIICQGKILQHSSMKALLTQVECETLIMELAQPLDAIPELGDFYVKKADANNLEIQITRKQNLNQLFELLTTQQILVKTIRTKHNRLEAFFLDLLDSSASLE